MIDKKGTFVFSDLSEHLQDFIKENAKLTYPRECCGFVFQCKKTDKYVVVPAENIMTSRTQYLMCQGFVQEVVGPLIYSNNYHLVALYHSHTLYDEELILSENDIETALSDSRKFIFVKIAMILIGLKSKKKINEIKSFRWNRLEQDFEEKEQLILKKS